jgi:hypothetical protein
MHITLHRMIRVLGAVRRRADVPMTFTLRRVATSRRRLRMMSGVADLTYEVSFKGVASPTLRAAFVDWELGTGVGTTWVRCTRDAFREVILRIEEFGLELLDVRLIAEADKRPGSAGR